MSRYTAATDAERAEMLRAVGVASIDELFDDIPPPLRLQDPLSLPEGRPEAEVYDDLRRLAERNVSTDDEVSFVGGGMYDHYVPAFVSALTQRAEFLTPYTPYQPEASQGTLQVMFEYQTVISELTSLPISNATLYDGPAATVAAAHLAKLTYGGSRVLVSRGLHPHGREALNTAARGFGAEIVEIPLEGGLTDYEALREAMGPEVFAVIVQQPNFLGAVEEPEALEAALNGFTGAKICACDPIALGLLKPPGEFGFDIAVGEGQPLGNSLSFGGPTFGFIAVDPRYLRKLPGRIAGQITDSDGRRAFCLTLQTREQHIRRGKATSNITTAQTLNALAAVSYLAWLGRDGLVELGELLLQRTAHLRARLAQLDGVSLLHTRPVVREFALSMDAPVDVVIACCKGLGINPGYALAGDYPEFPGGLLVALTERRSPADIDQLERAIQTQVVTARNTALA